MRIRLIVALVVVLCGQSLPAQELVGQRIIMLRGWAAVRHADNDRARTSVGINLVSEVIRVQGDRVWVGSTGGDDSGWVDRKDVLPLSEAIAYFDQAIQQNALDWDAYLRRAEVKHALNQSESATADYTRAIELHPTEAFLYLRRGRHLITRKICDGAMRDFAQAIRFAPTSVRQDYNLTAELYSLQSGVYASCPDGAFRDGRRAVETAAQAVSLDPSRPTLLTILAAAYASANDFSSAVQFQQRALNSSRFPSGYRDEAERQLRNYRESLTLQSTGR